MKKMAVTALIATLLITGFVFVGTITQTYSFNNILSWLAGVSFFPEGATTAELRGEYKKIGITSFDTINILIVPGHDQDSWGTQYGSLKEIDLNIELSLYLYDFLRSEKKFNVIVTQDKNGYNKIFFSYFIDSFKEIIEFIEGKRFIMKNAVKDELIDPHNGVIHNTATNKAIIKLYGINKWANENDIDIVIHIHFNDYGGRRNNSKKYDGFSIYTPENQYSNSIISNEIAKYIFDRLHTISSVSSLRQEKAGIVEDQELIAIGSNNTLDSAGMLIEYGYIYERQFTDKDTRSHMLKELAFLTYRGLIDFFEISDDAIVQNETSLLPYTWTKNIGYGTKGDESVLRLQIALMYEGVYPPQNSTINKCPVTGSFLTCTKKSVIEFQNKYKISPTGFVGPLTRIKLNELYSE